LDEFTSYWGDATCGTFVSDTPFTAARYGTCLGNPVEMTMNYMDYEQGNVYVFSNGQKIKNELFFLSGGARASFGI
jgi:hypothetical protein